MIWFLLKALLLLTLAYWALRWAVQLGARRAVENIIRGFSECSGDRSKLNEALKLHSPWYLLDGPSLIYMRGFDTEISTERVGRALYELALLEGKERA